MLCFKEGVPWKEALLQLYAGCGNTRMQGVVERKKKVKENYPSPLAYSVPPYNVVHISVAEYRHEFDQESWKSKMKINGICTRNLHYNTTIKHVGTNNLHWIPITIGCSLFRWDRACFEENLGRFSVANERRPTRSPWWIHVFFSLSASHLSNPNTITL